MLHQIAAITLMNIRSMPSRWQSSLVLATAVAGACSVLVGVMALAASFNETMHRTVRADRIIVLGPGAKSESGSGVSRDIAAFLESAPGIRRNGSNLALIKEIVIPVTLPLSPDGTLGEVILRGTSASSVPAVRAQMKIVEGRMPAPGTKEIVIGQLARSILAGEPQVGDDVSFHNDEWRIVGLFESEGDRHESEIWADAETVASLFRRKGFQSVTVMLDNPSAEKEFRSFVSSSPQATVEVWTEDKYVSLQSKRLNALLEGVTVVAGTIMTLGAILATVNAMLTSLAARQSEIAVLMALGFGRAPVIVSLLSEALLLAFAGAVAGAIATEVLFANVAAVSTVVGGTTKVVLRLETTLGQLSLAIALACVIALIGCIVPAIRTRSLSVSSLLRAA